MGACQSLKPVLSQCSQTGFVTVDHFIALYTSSYVFYSHGCKCNVFIHARTFFTVADTTSIPMGRCIYMQECSVHSLLRFLFPWVQCQSLKPVLNQCSQTGFVTIDDFIALYTSSYIFYSCGCNVFIHARMFFTLADTIAPIFTVITEVWPIAN